MTVFAMTPPSFPDPVQVLKELASGVAGIGVGNIDAVLAPVLNANAIATPAADGALGVVSTAATQLVLTQEATTAVETIFEGARGIFGP
jgi:hypothetical protein